MAHGRLQCYVDDPVLMLTGSDELRTKLLVRVLLLWLLCGLRISWKKVQRGSSVEWIGAQVAVDT